MDSTRILGLELAVKNPVNPANSSQLPVPFIDTVFQAINASEYILSGLSGNSQRDYIMGTAFGLYNQESANQILTAWARNNFTNTPHIKLVSGQNFNGAYAKDNNTIYLSGEFVAANSGNVGAVTGVLVEEVGHYLDSQINAKDADGDEGYIFSALVRGQSISPGELVSLKSEDDRAVISINGKYAYGRAIEKGLFQNNRGIGETVSLNAGSWDDQIGLSNVKCTPRINSFIIFDSETGGTTDSRGHVGFVEQVYADGSFLISESNWGNYLGFGLRHLSAGTKAKFIYL
ncbi:CHAP domain-containing protein [Dolichospermum flos-aquae]|jgi:hypothetical protein|uniref:CHAP domain-containing protein n=1 Tax=Dolichospermum flos-aquae CCAP 1403/13F TaxID=315271 RepID=A0A6H2BZM7_DOLFA|nr:CHAP domain-containing protein [Dolichospermum flos-aquae]QJB44416.1 CHAP domain-containing protein [Dolichospermum flos-aquae CCAP 1403/13F]